MKKSIVIVLFVAVFSFLIGSAQAVSYRRPPIPQRNNTVIIHDHKNNEQIITYLAIGMIAGAVIYKLSLPKCESGMICTRF